MPEIYKVPFIFASFNSKKNDSELINNVQSQYDVSNLIVNLLGYKVEMPSANNRVIYVNGSDLDGLSGYMKVKTNAGIEISKEIIH